MNEPVLPAEVWSVVFHKLDISQLLVIGVVAKQFFDGVLWCCGEVKSLTFLIGDGADQMRDSSQLLFPLTPEELSKRIAKRHHEWSVPQMSYDQCRKMGKVFTHVTHFEIALRLISCYDIEQLVTLLLGWKRTLVCLRITIERPEPFSSESNYKIFQFNAKHLLKKLSELTKLKHLTFVFLNELGDVKLDLSVVNRLNEFHFSSPDNMGILFNSLSKRITDTSTVRIDIQNKLTRQNELEKVNKIASNFVRLNMNSHYFRSKIELNSVTDKFTSLSTLSISIAGNLSFNKLSESLAKLNNLTHLELLVNFRSPEFIKWDTNVHKSNVPRLTTIKYLTLEVITMNRNDLFAINFEWIFPSVKKVKFVDHHSRFQIAQGVRPFNQLQQRPAPANLGLELEQRRARRRNLFQLEQGHLEMHEEPRRLRQRIERNIVGENQRENQNVDEVLALHEANWMVIVGRQLEVERHENQMHGRNHDNMIQGVFGRVEEVVQEEPPPAVVQAVDNDPHHYNNPEQRAQFIRDYLQTLKQSWKLELVEVYQRLMFNDEISPLLYSYTFDEL